MKEATVETSFESEFEPDAQDDRLLQELKDATAEAACVPPGWVHVAKQTFTWRLIDDDLATLALCFDSAVDQAVLVRSPLAHGPRMLSFESDDLGLEIDVRADQIAGQVLPPRPGVVRLRGADGSCRHTTADVTGWFVFERYRTGPHRFECDLGGPTSVTEWAIF
jgi:hypothetical protein